VEVQAGRGDLDGCHVRRPGGEGVDQQLQHRLGGAFVKAVEVAALGHAQAELLPFGGQGKGFARQFGGLLLIQEADLAHAQIDSGGRERRSRVGVLAGARASGGMRAQSVNS